jgi:hypothetical protein
MEDNCLTKIDFQNSKKDMIPTRDNDGIKLPKKNDEQNLVTSELIQVLHSKQNRIDELEQRLKVVEQQESQWKVNLIYLTVQFEENICLDKI